MNKPTRIDVNPNNIPQSLKAMDRWLVWKWEHRNGSWDKPPKQTNGRAASTANPETWTSFNEAFMAHAVGDFDGIGIVLPEGMVGIDLDDCIHGETLTNQAKMVLGMLPTYAEQSPSGTGVKLIAAGKLNPNLDSISHKKGVELYDGATTNRYFTITGQRVGESKEITGQREGLYALQTMLTDPVYDVTKIDPLNDDVDKALQFLDHIHEDIADDYHEWIKVGMALHWCDSSARMLERWKEWSSSSPKYSERECEYKWDSFKRESGQLCTIKFLERLAQANGFDPHKYQTRAITGEELFHKTIERTFIIDGFMVANEPMVIGGPSKTLKTSIALDMAVSIVTGTPFLGKFAVPNPRPCMIISGESGESTLQTTIRAIAEARGIQARQLDRLEIGFKLPKLDNQKCVDDLIEELRYKEIDTVFIDPLYRSLRAGEAASNIYAMGEKLELIAERIHRAGITLILLHHFRKTGRTYSEAPELEDLSQSGMAEFARQFLLLKRREAYKQDGNHKVWFSWGGSAGHQGLNILEAFDGVYPHRTWQSTLRSPTEFDELEKAAKKAKTEVEKEDEVTDLRERLLEAIGGNPAVSTSDLQRELKVRKSDLTSILEALAYENLIAFETGKRGSKQWHLITV
jgi:hypothetical protein